jgi:hypothetical protein
MEGVSGAEAIASLGMEMKGTTLVEGQGRQNLSINCFAGLENSYAS